MDTLFLANIRGWQLIIVLALIFVLLVIPFLLGLRYGRGKAPHRGRKK